MTGECEEEADLHANTPNSNPGGYSRGNKG